MDDNARVKVRALGACKACSGEDIRLTATLTRQIIAESDSAEDGMDSVDLLMRILEKSG